MASSQQNNLSQFIKDYVPESPVIRRKDCAISNDIADRSMGKTAHVFKGKLKDRTVAFKQFQYGSLNDMITETIVREIKVLEKLKHPNIVKYLGILDSGNITICMEYHPMDLYQSLGDAAHVSSFIKHQHQLALGVASALEALHKLHFLHRDIKPHNILVSETWEPVLCDFGLTLHLADGEHVENDRVGTSGWAAPEVMAGLAYSYPSDVFSYAMCVWAILHPGVPNPYSGLTSSKYYAEMKSGSRPSFTAKDQDIDGPDYVLLKNVCCKCWHLEERERPTFEEVVEMLDPAHKK
tara:strand:+ start:2428 stop:3312 length:885 start_codon:yes stop_codon:yes gene_type:complete